MKLPSWARLDAVCEVAARGQHRAMCAGATDEIVADMDGDVGAEMMEVGWFACKDSVSLMIIILGAALAVHIFSPSPVTILSPSAM